MDDNSNQDNFTSLNDLVSDQNNNDQNQVPVVSSGPEGMPSIETMPVEEAADTSQETEDFIPLEKLKTPEALSRREDAAQHAENNAIQSSTDTSTPVTAPNIVDKTGETTHIHHIQKPADELTEEADKEEERFIEEVEKHHGKL